MGIDSARLCPFCGDRVVLPPHIPECDQAPPPWYADHTGRDPRE